MGRNATASSVSTTRYGSVFSVTFITFTILLTGLSTVGLYLNLLNTNIFLKCGGSIPKRVRWFFVNCNLAYVLRSTTLLGVSFYHVSFLCLGGLGRADVPWTACAVGEFWYTIGFYAGYLACFGSSLERMQATFDLRTKDAAGWGVGLCCLFPWIVAIVLYLYAVVPASFTASPCLPYCHVTFLGVASTLNNIIYLMLVIQASTCAAYFLISWQNKRHLNAFTLTSKSHNLSVRFALWANVNATRWMIPVSVFHCIFQALINASAAFFRDYFKEFSTFYLAYLSILFCALAFEAISHPLLCIRNNEFFQRLLHSAHPFFIHTPFITQLFYGSIVLHEVGQNFSTNRVQPQHNGQVQETAVVNGFPAAVDPDPGCLPPLPPHTQNKPIAGSKCIVQYQANPEKFADALSKYWSKAAK